MKVVKEMEHSLLFNYFGLLDRYYLAVTVMTYFDFAGPDQAINEQEMWPFVQNELGKDAVLDAGMPKLKREVIVKGRCFSPDGKPRQASQVSFRVGDIEKTLYVFGNRYWKRKGGIQVITDPEPFTEMPVSWQNAFGGRDFPQNPLGKGFAPVIRETGEETLPLPNLEDPGRLIGSPDDRPEPACFLPIDFLWPQRAKKVGTYDDKWYRERWPFYPDDMDWTYFNVAPDDQQVEGYFTGGEAISIMNMHPGKPLIESHLPSLRQRCFVNQLEDFRQPKGEASFKEVATRLETVWLFPHTGRGIIIHRGTTEVSEDEARDITHVFVVTEPLHDQPKTIEHYYEEFKKRLDRKVPAQFTAVMEDANKKLADMKEQMKDIKLQIDDSIDRGLGQAPAPVRTPHEIITESMAMIDRQQQMLADAQGRFVDMKGKYGHIVKIDPNRFAQARQRLEDVKKELAEIPGRIDEANAKVADAQDKMQQKAKDAFAKIDPAFLKDKGFDPETMFEPLKTKKNPWHESGMRFIEKCRDNLREDREMFGKLRSLGFRPYTIKRHWLGINPEKQEHDPALWGLKKEGEAPHLLPAGLIIPRFDQATLDKITVRPDGMTDASGDSLIEGSKDAPLVLGAGEGKPYVRVAEELEAMLLHQELGSLCAVAVLKDPKVKPDGDAAKWLKESPQFLVVVYPHEDKSIAGWEKACPQAEPLLLPEGKNIFEAGKAGVDLYKWVFDALKPGIVPEGAERIEEEKKEGPGANVVAVPVFDVAGAIKKVRDTVNARIQPQLAQLEARKKEIMDLAGKRMVEMGRDPRELLKTPDKSILKEANPFQAAKEKFAEEFAKTKETLKKFGQLTPEIEAKLADAEKGNQQLLQNAAKQYEEGMAKLAAAEAQVKAGMPGWAKKLLEQAGVDPDDPAPLRILSRDEVVERFKKGLSLAGKNLTGVDLSGLELPGIILSKANLQKAKLAGCNLDGADLTSAIATEADFSRTSLKEAKMGKGLFQKAKFVDARMRLTDLTQAVMSEADLSGADLTGAQLEKTLLEKARLIKAKLTDARVKQGYFLSADVSQADFSGADITKAVFLTANIDQVNFSGGSARGTIFIETKGQKINFSGADMFNSRIINESVMTGSDFTNTKAEKACWMRSDLSGSDFRKSDIKRGLVQECNLAGTNLTGVTAKQARFTKTDLSDANLRGANIMFGSLRKSVLVRTDLTGANLYGAEFFRTGVGDTRFEDANLKMTKLYKRTDLLKEKPRKG